MHWLTPMDFLLASPLHATLLLFPARGVRRRQPVSGREAVHGRTTGCCFVARGLDHQLESGFGWGSIEAQCNVSRWI
jgi:hypothetical protein